MFQKRKNVTCNNFCLFSPKICAEQVFFFVKIDLPPVEISGNPSVKNRSSHENSYEVPVKKRMTP